MSLLTIEGTYRDGKIELAERPEGLDDETPVLVAFLSRPESGPGSIAGPDESRETLRRRAFARMEAGLQIGRAHV